MNIPSTTFLTLNNQKNIDAKQKKASPLACKVKMQNFKSIYNTQGSSVYFRGIEKTAFKEAETQKVKQIKGCLLGGAIGDALGAKIESYTYDRIKSRFGESGLHYIPKRYGVCQITDDTQMTLFTTEALLKNYIIKRSLSEEPNYNIIYRAYLDWYKTQTEKPEDAYSRKGLLGDPTMYAQRNPGYTCMTALKTGTPGTLEKPINNSYGNGGLMRSAPIGLLYKDPALAFTVAAKATALTHGHPDAYLSAGCFAAMISNLINGKDIDSAIKNSVSLLKKYKNNEYTLENIQKAIELAKTDSETAKTIDECFGRGVNSAEALGIALYCVLKYPDNFKKTVIAAVNHGGDSDTTGAIAGNISGLINGSNSVPTSWHKDIEHIEWINKYAKTIDSLCSEDTPYKFIVRYQNEKASLEHWRHDKLL